jgi:hypothetical protein
VTVRKGGVPLLRIFGIPLAIAAVSIVGLVAALVGDGPLDAVSWIGLLIPLLVMLWALLYRRS